MSSPSGLTPPPSRAAPPPADGEAGEASRLGLLRRVAAAVAGAASLEACLEAGARALCGGAAGDPPFALGYRVDVEARRARLVIEIGLPAGGPASPARIDLAEASGWPVA
ncbi:MAG TPA: hypothetical protein VHO06_16530, partial [Polyangia bacterium]|nr:hypothetical protein [Polyangia bacterium]